MANIFMEVSEKDEITVINPQYKNGNLVTIKIGEVEIVLPVESAVELQESLEKAVVNMAYWHETMDKENERLMDRVEMLEETLESMGWEE